MKATVLGSATVALFGESKSNAEVRSPVTARRHGVMFDSMRFGWCLPKRRSTKRMVEVWSKTWESTQPPLLQGEITIMGTRTPDPIEGMFQEGQENLIFGAINRGECGILRFPPGLLVSSTHCEWNSREIQKDVERRLPVTGSGGLSTQG